MTTKFIRKGDQFKDATGGVYTVQSLNIKNQQVIYTYEETGVGVDTKHMSASDWRKLIAVDPATTNLEVPGPDDKRRLGPATGTKFQMMDKSNWEISVVTDEYLTISNGTKEQTLPLDDYRELLKHQYITVL